MDSDEEFSLFRFVGLFLTVVCLGEDCRTGWDDSALSDSCKGAGMSEIRVVLVYTEDIFLKRLLTTINCWVHE